MENNKITFCHLADSHIGGFSNTFLKDLNFYTFQKAIKRVIDLKPDFTLFAGDIFDTFMPGIEIFEKTTSEFLKLKNNNIPLYIIGGSHDYSTSQKSFLDILDITKVLKNLSNYKIIEKGKVEADYILDKKTNSFISGIYGMKNGLDKNLYSNLKEIDLEKFDFSVFMFHTTLNDFKPKSLENVEVKQEKSYLPKGFNYYAGGHIHTHMTTNYDKGVISYPGPLFPNSFFEMINETPSFNYCIFDKITKKLEIKRIFLETYQKVHIKIDVDNLSSLKAKEKIENEISKNEKNEIKDKLLFLEIYGEIKGKIKDLEINKIISKTYEDFEPRYVLRNTSKIRAKVFEKNLFENKLEANEIEKRLISKFLEESNDFDFENNYIKNVLNLDLSKLEEERVNDFENRIIKVLEEFQR